MGVRSHDKSVFEHMQCYVPNLLLATLDPWWLPKLKEIQKYSIDSSVVASTDAILQILKILYVSQFVLQKY